MKKRECLFCSKDITGSHSNRKYCSTNCYDKYRYKNNGHRSTKDQRKEWYSKRMLNKEYVEKIRSQGRGRDKLVKEFLAKYKLSKKCHDCGYNKHHAALDFDHVTGEKHINVCFSKSIKQAKLEIEKCEVVCSNCHRIRTYNRIYPLKN